MIMMIDIKKMEKNILATIAIKSVQLETHPKIVSANIVGAKFS